MEQKSYLLDLPTELLLKIIEKTHLGDFTMLLLTSKKIKQSIYQWCLSEECQMHLKSRYANRSYSPQTTIFELIKNDITLLKPSYRSIHPDYQYYQTLKSLSPQMRIQQVVSRNSIEFQKVFVRYAELYQDCLYIPSNIECKVLTNTPQKFAKYRLKSWLTEPLLGLLLPMWVLLSPIVMIMLPLMVNHKKIINYMKCSISGTPILFFQNRLVATDMPLLELASFFAQLEKHHHWHLIRNFAHQLIASNYLSTECYIKALKAIEYDYSHPFQAAAHIANLIEAESIQFASPENFRQAFEDAYQAYLLLKALLEGCQQQDHEQQLLQQIKKQARAKLTRQTNEPYFFKKIGVLIAKIAAKLSFQEKNAARLSP